MKSFEQAIMEAVVHFFYGRHGFDIIWDGLSEEEQQTFKSELMDLIREIADGEKQ